MISILTAGSVTNNDIMLVTFLWRVWSTWKAMVFTKEDEILIKVLRQSKSYSARKLLGGISWQGLVLFSTGPTSAADWRSYRVCRQEIRQQQRMYDLHKRHTNVCANGDHFEHKLLMVLRTNCWGDFSILETSVFEFNFVNSCCSKTVQQILLKFAKFAAERW